MSSSWVVAERPVKAGRETAGAKAEAVAAKARVAKTTFMLKKEGGNSKAGGKKRLDRAWAEVETSAAGSARKRSAGYRKSCM